MSVNFDLLKFPSGRSVGNCRADAKRLSRSEGIPHHTALDRIAADNGVPMPWARALDLLATMPAVPRPPASGDLPPPIITRAQVELALSRHPTLCRTGFGVDHHRLRPAERAAKLAELREDLLANVREINVAAQFLRLLTKRRPINRQMGSYSLKHVAERYFSQPGSPHEYIANGSCICAADIIGFRIQQIGSPNPNAYFNVSGTSPVLLWDRYQSWSEWDIPTAHAKVVRQFKAQLNASPPRAMLPR